MAEVRCCVCVCVSDLAIHSSQNGLNRAAIRSHNNGKTDQYEEQKENLNAGARVAQSL